MKRGVCIAAIAAIALGACSKEVSNVGDTPATDVQSFRDLKVPQGFDFSATKSVTILLPGNSDAPAQTQALIKVMDASENVLLKYKASVAKGFEMPLELPAATKELTVIGIDGNKKNIEIVNGQLNLK